MPFQHRNDIIGIFAQHKVAANLMMVVMLLAGAWGLANLNVQFFPNFEVEIVSVRTVWTGASAEDVERSLTIPLEQALRTTQRQMLNQQWERTTSWPTASVER